MDVVVPIAAGAVIGYVTNWLAIKMLFWPREPKYVFGRQLPLTPGLFVRRRGDFSSSISSLVENRFANADDLYAMVQKAEDNGLIVKFLDEMGPLFAFVFRLYMRRTTAETFRRDCRRIAAMVKRRRIISSTVKKKIDDMDTIEMEAMIMAVVRKELGVITWLGAVLGAGIGALQAFLS